MLLFGNFEPIALLAIGIVLLFGMGWHEYAHAVVADWWGDPTPRSMGRLTPNPVVHISWVGWLMFLILGFGILGSVPVNPRNMRDPRWGSFWTSFAGPLSNLAQAIVFGVVAQLLYNFAPDLVTGSGLINAFIADLLVYGVLFNILLFIFNLIPFFPMDGWHMMLAILPGEGLSWKDIPSAVRQYAPALASFLSQPAYKWQAWSQYSMYVFFGLLMLGFVIPQLDVLSLIIGQPTFRLTYTILSPEVFLALWG